MPVYLCKSGAECTEPWRYGIQVYGSPFPIDSSKLQPTGGRDLIVATSWTPGHEGQQPIVTGHPIRRVRHAEVVLVDNICIAYDRFWLRLRWPGRKGGFAGYIAMGLVSETLPQNLTIHQTSDDQKNFKIESSPEERGGAEDADLDDPAREEERQETGSMPPSEPYETSSGTITCLRTGLAFQSSIALSLLAVYDDGILPPVALIPFSPEPVFCRICREGLHEDADEEQPVPEAEDGGDDDDLGTCSRQTSGVDDRGIEGNSATGNSNSSLNSGNGPVQPHPAYSANADALSNPILAPCECSGSMAFVHYLCVEQWRCRSRHPEAHHGLNCETCGAPYALPPPSERPQVQQIDQEDWLDAMPPHVMQALRQPHIWWQIGAAIVRRRWLRPLAPIFMSPIVALYCRARRLLKKRGVARRRWACSLCRRRARWKCVRCLRSYYCSRQCQNVSWHIVHKHVCYKPARFWWSVIVYAALAVAVFPGIIRDPFLHALGFLAFPASFVVMGIIGGGIAVLTRKVIGMDLRGRLMELYVLVCTLYLSFISWGVVKGFFGNPAACHGAIGRFDVPVDNIDEWAMLYFLRKLVLQLFKSCYLFLDGLPRRTKYAWLEKAVCTTNDGLGCFEHLPHANLDFFCKEEGGERCAADLMLLGYLYLIAGMTYVGTAIWKHHERQRRRRRPVRVEQRPHLD